MVAKTPQDFKERASRKPAPKTEQAWLKEVRGVHAFVMAKPQHLENSGKAWYDSMAGYYSARLAFLKANIPPGMVKTTAREMAAKIAKSLP